MEENEDNMMAPEEIEKPKRGRKKKISPPKNEPNLPREKLNEVWLSVSEAAKVGGVQTKTVRRAIQGSAVKYKIVNDRYLISFVSLITYLHSNKKLKNKLNEHGIGQYVSKWQ